MVSVKTGYVIFVYETGKLSSKAIRWATTYKGEDKTKANHVACVLNTIETVQAIPPEVARSNVRGYLAHLESKGGCWCGFRPATPLTLSEEMLCRRYLVGMIGTKYSHWANCLALFDSFLTKIRKKDTVCFRKLDHLFSWINCSGVAGTMAHKIGRATERMMLADPDMLYDFMVKSEQWEQYDSSKGWGTI